MPRRTDSQRAARAYMQQNPGVTYRQALTAVTNPKPVTPSDAVPPLTGLAAEFSNEELNMLIIMVGELALSRMSIEDTFTDNEDASRLLLAVKVMERWSASFALKCNECGTIFPYHNSNCYHADCDEDDYEVHGCGIVPYIKTSQIATLRCDGCQRPVTLDAANGWYVDEDGFATCAIPNNAETDAPTDLHTVAEPVADIRDPYDGDDPYHCYSCGKDWGYEFSDECHECVEAQATAAGATCADCGQPYPQHTDECRHSNCSMEECEEHGCSYPFPDMERDGCNCITCRETQALDQRRCVRCGDIRHIDAVNDDDVCVDCQST